MRASLKNVNHTRWSPYSTPNLPKCYFKTVKTYIESALNEALALAPEIFLVFAISLNEPTEKQTTPTNVIATELQGPEHRVLKKKQNSFMQKQGNTEEYWRSCLDYGRPIGLKI